MNLELKHFKNELSDYNYLKSKISRLETLKLELETRRGVSAIQYDKEITQGSPDPILIELKRIEDCDRADYLDKELLKFYKRLDYINNFIDHCEIGTSIKNIHCLGTSTYLQESINLSYSVRQLKRLVNKEIIKYLQR